MGRRMGSLFLCLDPGASGSRSYIHLPSHTLMPASPTQRLASGSHVLVQMACGIRKPGGSVVSGKSLGHWDPQSPPRQAGKDRRNCCSG